MWTIKTKLKHSYKESTTKWNPWRVFPELASWFPMDLSDGPQREQAPDLQSSFISLPSFLSNTHMEFMPPPQGGRYPLLHSWLCYPETLFCVLTFMFHT